jgi:hypothetical protein
MLRESLMHLFEALLIVFGGQLTLAAAAMGARRPRWTHLLPLVLLAPLGAHLGLEGPRWQMGPAYLVVAGACALGALRYFAVLGGRAGHVLSRALGAVGFLLLMLSAGAAIFVP